MHLPSNPDKSGPILSAIDRSLIAEYRLLGWPRIPAIIAVAPEQTGRLVAELMASGAHVAARQDDIGYIYAGIPEAYLAAILEQPGVERLQIGAGTVRGSGANEPTKTPEDKLAEAVAPTCYLPADNPYTAEYATQALAFKAASGGIFDGRGVVIAFVEPAAPNMATMRGSLAIGGQRLPKYAFYDLGPPEEPLGESVATPPVIWQRTTPVMPDSSGSFAFAGKTYRLPSGSPAGEWRVCVRRPYAWETKPISYTVAWAVEAGVLLVLPDKQGDDFARATRAAFHEDWAMVQVGDAAAWRENADAPRCFIFNADRTQGLLGFTLAYSHHGGMVASVMAGQGFLGSDADGVAPAAQLAVFQRVWQVDAPNRNIFEEIIAGIRSPAVDILEASVTLGDTARFNARSVYRVLADRLLVGSHKIFVKSAGNHGPILDRIKELESSSEVFTVGAYAPKETWQVNFGLTPSAEYTPSSMSGYGPAVDGGLKPDFLALTHTLCEGLSPSVYYDLPDGYKDFGVSGITSSSAPHGAANIALLVSAAKQNGLAYDRARVRAAIASTAQFLPGVEARAQGHGLIQTADAWEALRRAQAWEPPQIESRAPVVRAEPGPFGALVETGRGLFEMAGWSPGTSGQRELIFTRISGGPEAQCFELRWKGKTDNFGSKKQEICLPLGKAVALTVDIAVGVVGSYSTILNLIDPQTQLVAHNVMLTVMSAETLVEHNGYTARFSGEVHRPGNALIYVKVPPGLSLLSIRLKKDRNKCFWWAQDPTGRMMPYRLYGSEVMSPQTSWTNQLDFSEVYPDPVPGVWQFCIQNRAPFSREELKTEEWPKTMPYEVEVCGRKIETLGNWEKGVPGDSITASFRNLSSDLPAQIKPVGLGAARAASALLKPGIGQVSYEMEVPEGATRIEVSCEHAVLGARLGFYVFKIPSPERREKTLKSDNTALIYHDPSLALTKRCAVDAPKPGRYQVTLDLVEGGGEGVTVSYRDIVFHPYLGEMTCTGSLTTLKTNEVLENAVTVVVRARPDSGRQLIAQAGLFSTSIGYSKPADGPTGSLTVASHKAELVEIPVATQTWCL